MNSIVDKNTKRRRIVNDWIGVILGFLIAAATTLMSIIDFTSVSAGSPFKELTTAQIIFISISILIKGLTNMFIFRSFIKNGIEKGKKEQDYQDHLDYQDEQITLCLPYREEIDKKCEEDNFKELHAVYFEYCNHHRINFNALFKEDLTLNHDYIPKNKKEAKAIKNIHKNCFINEISSAMLFDSSVGGWERNKKFISEKEYISKNSSPLLGMIFGFATSILSIAPFHFSVSGLLMAFVNFGVVISLAIYKFLNAMSYVKDDLGNEIKRRGLKLESFYIEIKKEEKLNADKKIILSQNENNQVEKMNSDKKINLSKNENNQVEKIISEVPFYEN
jgi:hypothetical protein